MTGCVTSINVSQSKNMANYRTTIHNLVATRTTNPYPDILITDQVLSAGLADINPEILNLVSSIERLLITGFVPLKVNPEVVSIQLNKFWERSWVIAAYDSFVVVEDYILDEQKEPLLELLKKLSLVDGSESFFLEVIEWHVGQLGALPINAFGATV